MGFLQFICRHLPAALVYHCVIRVWVEATRGLYGKTDPLAITANEAIVRFARIHGLAGHGKDEYFDSNRGWNA